MNVGGPQPEPHDAVPDRSPVDPDGAQRHRKTHPLFRALQVIALAAVLGLLGLLVWRLTDATRRAALVKDVNRGQRPAAPGFTLSVLWPEAATWPSSAQRLLDQPKLSLRQLAGRPIVLNFWASWCGPCKKEAPVLNEAARSHAGDVLFLGIDVQDLKSDARSFLRRHHVAYPSLHDNSGATYDGYGLTGVPETYWINARGRIVEHYSGQVTAEIVENGIREAIGRHAK